MAHDDHIKIDLNKIDTLKSEKTKDIAIETADRGLNSGMAIGGVFGWLVGFEMFELPGIGFILATGPIGAALTGIAIGGPIGRIGGALLSLGISKLETKKIEAAIKEKGIIVSVHVDDPRELMVAKNILVSNGAMKVFNPQKTVHQRGPSPFLFKKGMSH
jgi:hypothetical protein